MGFFSWFRSCGTTGDDEPPSLLQLNDDPRFDELRRAASEDLALLEQDNRPDGGDAPGERAEPGEG